MDAMTRLFPTFAAACLVAVAAACASHEQRQQTSAASEQPAETAAESPASARSESPAEPPAESSSALAQAPATDIDAPQQDEETVKQAQDEETAQEEVQEPKKKSNVEIKSIRVVPPPRPEIKPRVALLDESFPYDENHPAVGHWHGNVITQMGVLSASLDVLRDDDEEGGYTVVGTIAPGNLPNQKAEAVEIDWHIVTFKFPIYTAPREIAYYVFDGEVSDNGQRMLGSVGIPEKMIENAVRTEDARREFEDKPKLTAEERARLREEMAAATFELARTPVVMELPKPMAYSGQVEPFEGVPFDITLVIAETPGGNWLGHIDIKQQAVAAWPLDRIERTGDTIIAHIGAPADSRFEGTLSEDGRTFSGDYVILEERFPFTFEYQPEYTVPEFPRAADARPEPSRAGLPSNRPQYPGTPYPYAAHEITFQTPQDQILAGTLTVPEGSAPFPAAILLSDSGPQDRDHTIYGQKSFLVLADYLTRQGIAVLRYDDREVGLSSGSFSDATIEDFAQDAAAAFNYLRQRGEIDPERIGFIGLGEGSLVAARAAGLVEDPAYVVMLSGIGVTGWRHELSKLEQILDQVNADAAVEQAVIDAQRALYEAFVEGADDEKLNELALAYADAQKAFSDSQGGRSSAAREGIARIVVARMKTTPMEFFLAYDPAPSFQSLDDVPVLALWGSLDREAVPALNQPAVEAAIGNSGGDVTVKVYEGMNHLFQPAETGATSEYSKSRITFDENVMRDIAEWIGKQSG